jgi:putative ABC transport system permease protein
MKIEDHLEEMFLSMSSNKVRSGLTMLGIVIGIASVIAMLSIGQGAKAQIESSIESIGSNLLMIQPGAQRGAGSFVSSGRGSATTLTLEDAEELSGAEYVGAVAPEASRRYQVTASGNNTNTQVMGTTPSYLAVRNVSVELGTFFTDAQTRSRAKVAVLGPTTRDDLFGEGASPIGQKIRVNGINFTIVGVTAAKGGSGFSNQDDMIFIPVTAMQTYLSGGESVSTISVQAVDQASMALAQQSVTETLLVRHGISDPLLADFSVMNQSDIVSMASSVTDTFTMLLASIAGISLLVGGIGIMNMMLTTVTERTREIGLRQAVGARKSEIVTQFLGEAILLTLIGGLAGILFGYGAAKAISAFAGTATSVSWASVGLAAGVSIAIGLIFGYYPARRAAQLNPIQALRYE